MVDLVNKAAIRERVTKERIRVAMHEAFDDALKRTSIVQIGQKWQLIETDAKAGIVKRPKVTEYDTQQQAAFGMRDKALKAAFLALAPLVEQMVLEELLEPKAEALDRMLDAADEAFKPRRMVVSNTLLQQRADRALAFAAMVRAFAQEKGHALE